MPKNWTGKTENLNAPPIPIARRLPKVAMPEAIDHMIVYHSHGLHKGVADRAAHKFEATPLQVLAQGIRFRGPGGNFLDRLPGVLPRLVANEFPDVISKGADFI